MPTSGQIVARDAFVQVEDSGATLRTISTDLNEATINPTVETPETTAFGDSWRTRAGSGLRDVAFSFTGLFSDTASTGVETVLSGILSENSQIVIGPAGSATGYRKYTACTLLTGYTITSGVADMISIGFDMVLRAGSLTMATF